MSFMDLNSLHILTPLGFCLAVVAILTIVSILANGFIVTVNIQDWLKSQKLNPVDQILLALGLSNAGLSYSFANYIFLFLWPQFFLVDYAFIIVFAVIYFLSLSSSWLTAWLCYYFFVKIIHFKSNYLVKLKLTIHMVVPWLIVISEVVALFNSLQMVWSFPNSLPYNYTLCNRTSPTVSFRVDTMYNIFALGFSSNSAFFIVLVSAISIVWSLCRHMYHMKKTMSSEERSVLRIYQKAAQTVVSLLVIYIVFYVTFILMTTLFSSNTISICYWITVWVSQSTSLAMSLVLIHGNSKLSLAFHKIFCFYPPLE